jgi:hypothetical protein
LKIDYRDASGTKGSSIFHFPYATLAAVVVAVADILSAALNALSDAAVDGYTITYAKTEDTPATPTAGSRVENKGQFVYRTANGRTTRFSIPAIVASVLNASGSINKDSLLVTALSDAIIAGDFAFASADGSDITALLQAYQRMSGSTKNQLPSDR